ncbi:MAG: MBL fold metallo-hydrolase [Acidimicrobiia bacterium]|nr:MBL fold metallo-hydrolase [Acidimicrobiia bacterium]
MNVALVLAPNPGLMTGPGTNTWILSSDDEAIVVDPGPEIPEHLAAIESALGGLGVVAVVVTHSHPDHAPLASPLARRLGVPAVGPAPGPGFRPDRLIADGESVGFGGSRLVALATPGHTPDSTCYRVDDALFTGDHIMGGSTVMVEDMGDYVRSLRAVQGIGLRVIYPGHGPIITEPDRVVGDYLSHRLERERQILAAVRSGAATVGAVVQQVYADVDPALHLPAAVSVDAHLRKLADDGLVRYRGGGWMGGVEALP